MDGAHGFFLKYRVQIVGEVKEMVVTQSYKERQG